MTITTHAHHEQPGMGFFQSTVAPDVTSIECASPPKQSPYTRLANLVGFTDSLGRTSCAVTEQEHYHLRAFGYAQQITLIIAGYLYTC
jgi:hypothetical protein